MCFVCLLYFRFRALVNSYVRSGQVMSWSGKKVFKYCLWFSKGCSSSVSCLLQFRVRSLLCPLASGQVMRTCRIESLLYGGWLGYLRIYVDFKLSKLLNESYIMVWTKEWRKVREAFIHASVEVLEFELSSADTWWPLVASKGVVR